MQETIKSSCVKTVYRVVGLLLLARETERRQSAPPSGVLTYICQGELLWWFVLWTHHQSNACLSLTSPGAWREEPAGQRKAQGPCVKTPNLLCSSSSPPGCSSSTVVPFSQSRPASWLRWRTCDPSRLWHRRDRLPACTPQQEVRKDTQE